jgi:hypothetical protein
MLDAFGTDMSVKVVRPPTQAVSAEKSAAGNIFTETVLIIVSWHPLMLLMIRVTVKDPLFVKAWDGFCMVDVLLTPDPGSPKFQFQEMTGLPPFSWEMSLNRTSELAQLTADQPKLAIGEGTLLTACSI